MTTGIKEAQARADDARRAVEEAEAGLAAGGSSISATVLHKLRDAWRHADLSARGARQRADEERRDQRLKGLTEIGEETVKLAGDEHSSQVAAALRQVTAAVDLVKALAAAHDADVAELIAAATDLGAEPKALNGPRATSAYIAVEGSAIHYRNLAVGPIGPKVEAALQQAMSGDPGKAVAEMRPASQTTTPKRPDHLLRNPSGGLFPMDGQLNAGFQSQIRTGALTELSQHDIDRYMAGELE